MKATTTSASAESPESRLNGFIDKFDAVVARQIRSVRKALRKRLPGAVELVYDNYNFFVIGYGPNERASEAVLSITAQAKGVSILFHTRGEAAGPDRSAERRRKPDTLPAHRKRRSPFAG
jgi:hypothetical protein